MTLAEILKNRLKALRIERGWSQEEVARRAGISRAAVSAIEIERLTPSVTAALSLAAAFACTVETLFGSPAAIAAKESWAWLPPAEPWRGWRADVQGRALIFPVESGAVTTAGHDGIFRQGTFAASRIDAAPTTLVLACCDPAAAMMAAEYARRTGFRLLVFPRSSQESLALLAEGTVHVAGLHLTSSTHPEGNAAAVRARLGEGYQLVRVARWQEGLALRPEVISRTVRSVLQANLRWVGRELGSAARQCLDDIWPNRPPPRRIARSHRSVAEALHCGWADAGVCLQLASEEAGLRFIGLREETFDFCFAARSENDPRVRGLIGLLRSTTYRQLLGDLPGYDSTQTGDVQLVGK
jgi:molybdate-binding protein/DNA-binding XRE family transcriptional regulator